MLQLHGFRTYTKPSKRLRIEPWCMQYFKKTHNDIFRNAKFIWIFVQENFETGSCL